MRKIVSFLIFLALSCALFAQQTATPRKGEGLDAFLRRNNITSKEQKADFIELNKKNLGPNNTLKLGVKYKLPTSGKSSSTKTIGSVHKNSLFGSKYAEYTIESNKLNGACFYLVCGHGGPDPGAIAKVDGKTLSEDEYAYDIVLRLARNMLSHGATVHIIIQDAKDGIRDDKYLANSNRETCMGSTIPLNQTQRLKQRAGKINELSKKSSEKYKRALFIHLDSRNRGHRVDVFFYHHPKSTQGKGLANTLKKTFDTKYKKHQPNRGYKGTVSDRNLYVLNNTNPVGVFIELGNIQNAEDRKRFLDSDNRQAVANHSNSGKSTTQRQANLSLLRNPS